MASASDIRAGRAYVELYTRDSKLVAGLNAIGGKMKSFGAGTMAAGGAMMGLASAIASPLVAASAAFADYGSQLNDMSVRTGMSTEALSELGYAAKMTGGSLETIEKSARKMSAFMLQVERGSKNAKKTLSDLGVTADELKGMTPEQRMERLADALSKITDPGERAALAMQVFGKTGTEMLPMLEGGAEGLRKLREEARAMGASMSAEDAAKADELGDAWDRLKTQAFGAAMSIGAALAPKLTKLLGIVSSVISKGAAWIKQNAGLAVSIAGLAVGLGIAGAAVVAFGAVVWGAGAAITALAAVIGFITSPIGLAVAALAGIGYAAWRAVGGLEGFKNIAGRVLEWLGPGFQRTAAKIGNAFRELVGDLQKAWKGVGDALAAGDVGAAMKVITTTINLEWTKAVNFVQGLWGDFRLWWSGLTNSLAGFMVDACAKIQTIWIGALAFIQKAWAKWAASDFTAGIADMLAPIMAELYGVDVADVRANLKRDFEYQQSQLKQRLADIDTQAKQKKDEIETERQAKRGALDSAARAAKEARDKRAGAAQAEVDAARKDRDDALKRAAEARAEAERKKKQEEDKQPGPDTELPGMASAMQAKSTVTFSGYALAGLGANGPAERTARSTSEIVRLLRAEATRGSKEAKDLLDAIKRQAAARFA